MFRPVTILAALTVAGPAAGSIPVPSRDDAREVLRVVKDLRPAPPTRPPAQPYQLTADTEVWLDGRRADYRSVPAGARIESLEVTPDGVILKVRFLSAARLPSAGGRR